MTKHEFYILNDLYNGRQGRGGCTSDIDRTRALDDQAAINALTDAGLIARDTGALTGAGLAALEPYRVDNAVILAAGASTRFIPLSLEQPKGLFEVKGEKLIERQIQQLKAAGIDDITVVLGYKKEMFFYLKEKYGVKFIINDAFNIKNNIESLYLARNELKNTYVCVSDSYFVENPFNRFEYQTFYAGLSVSEAVNELYVDTDSDGKIIRMAENRDAGRVLLGHSFWRKEFSDAFIALAEADREVGRYHACFWEWLVKDYLAQLPPMYYKEYTPGTIFEFDYFEELRQFDTQYLSHTHSGTIRNIKLVFRCDEEDIVDFRNVSEGMTNTSFIFKIDGVDYIYRHPGDGTDSIINRRNEKTSLIKAKQLGIDPTYIYADVNEGWKTLPVRPPIPGAGLRKLCGFQKGAVCPAEAPCFGRESGLRDAPMGGRAEYAEAAYRKRPQLLRSPRSAESKNRQTLSDDAGRRRGKMLLPRRYLPPQLDAPA